MTADLKRPRPIRLAPGQWKKLRDRVCSSADGAGARCAGCGRYGFAHDLDAHHVYGRDLGGDDLLVNLAPMHRPCHATYEDRAPGWEELAAGIRASSIGTPFVAYLAVKLGSHDAALAWVDRYYPDRREKEAEHAA